MKLVNVLAAALVTMSLCSAGAAWSAAWPHPRGPALDGRVDAPGTFDGEAIGLDLAWRIPLGSGYSGIAVGADRVITMFSDGDDDWVAAFDVASGDERWRQSLGARYYGHDGSDDGPLSSPVLGAGAVFAIGPRGTLLAVDLDTGDVRWKRHLGEDFEAPSPEFGYTTTPIFVDGAVVVLTGTPGGRSITALRATDGEPIWHLGEGGVEYQSPVIMALAGQRQIIAHTDQGIVGIAPKEGTVLWQHAFAEGEGAQSAVPTPLDDGRFLLPIRRQAAVFQVTAKDGGFDVTEQYRSRALGRSYAPAVLHEGRLYGFSGQILTCVDAATGERLWRSRPPGGEGGLIVVDDHLVIFGAKGSVVVADAAADGYHERARVEALGGSSLTWPAFADGRVFVRNLDSLAAVTIGRGSAPASMAEADTGDHAFGQWLARAEAAEDKAKAVAELVAAHPKWPIVDGKHVTFLFQGEATDVALAGTMLDNRSEPMSQVAGTDLFYRTLTLEPDVRWEYQFQVDYDQWHTDPKNPNTVPGRGTDPISELRTAGEPSPRLAPPSGARGSLERFTLTSKPLELDKEIAVWTPPGYAGGEARHPLLVVTDGDRWIDNAQLPTMLDNLSAANAIQPPIVAFVPAQRAWWVESGGARTDDYVTMLVDELLPTLRERYRLRDGGATILGNRHFGLTAAYAALRHPKVFDRVALQSVATGGGVGPAMEALIDSKTGPGVRWYLDWNRYDERNVDRGSDFAETSRALDAKLRSRGYAVEGGEVLDSWGWGGWRDRADRFLIHHFAPTR